MIYEFGNMFSVWEQSDLFCITTNATIKSNGALVMGRGIAKTVRDKYPGVDLVAGKLIEERCGSEGLYGLIISPDWPAKKLGLFQVKYRYDKPATGSLIVYSTGRLKNWALEHSDARIDLNFPGIGNGKLPASKVEPIIRQLPNNVHVWQFDSIAQSTRDCNDYEEWKVLMSGAPNV
jgi:hypothetical protein